MLAKLIPVIRLANFHTCKCTPLVLYQNGVCLQKIRILCSARYSIKVITEAVMWRCSAFKTFRKTTVAEFLFNKVAGIQLYWKESQTQVFSCSSVKWSYLGHLFKSQSKICLSFPYTLFFHILWHEKVTMIALFTITIIFYLLFLVKKK